HALFRGLVGQHQTTHHVTDRINARHRGGAVVVDEDVTTLIQGNAAVGCQQVGGDRTAAHRHDQLVEHHFLIALGIGVANSDFLTLDFGAGYPGTQLDVQTLLGVDLHRFLGQLLVRGDQELVQRLDDGHFSAQTRPYGAELQTDHAGTDHTQALGHGGELQRAGGIDNDLLVNRSRGNLHRTRARGEDDVLRSQHFAAAVGLGNFDLLTGQQLAVAFIYGHTISLEQPGNTAGQGLVELILAANHRRHVHLHLAGADAVHAEGILGLMEFPGAVQQRLGGYAAYVQAGSTESQLAILALVLLDTGGLESQLGSTDGGNVTTGPGTNNDYIEFIAHNPSSVFSCISNSC